MPGTFTIADLRRERQETLEQFAQTLGLKSKGQASQIERGEEPCSFEVALTLETLSTGRLDAAALNDKVALARKPANAA